MQRGNFDETDGFGHITLLCDSVCKPNELSEVAYQVGELSEQESTSLGNINDCASMSKASDMCTRPDK